MSLDQTLSELTSLPIAERLRAVEMLRDSMATRVRFQFGPNIALRSVVVSKLIKNIPRNY